MLTNVFSCHIMKTQRERKQNSSKVQLNKVQQIR